MLDIALEIIVVKPDEKEALEHRIGKSLSLLFDEIS